jgi:hypothetical protein
MQPVCVSKLGIKIRIRPVVDPSEKKSGFGDKILFEN